jgi:hypothetical protein
MSDKAIRYGRLVIDGFLVWKLAAFKCLLKACLAVGGAFVAQVGSGLTTQKLMENGPIENGAIVVGLLIVFGSNIDAFLDKTLEGVSKRLGLENAGNTEVISK